MKPTCVEAHEKEIDSHEKKAKKKINFWWRKKKKRSPSLSHDVNVPRHPFLFFFLGTSTVCTSWKMYKHRQKKLSCCCVVQFFININNETLVWSEKDGGSAFAGGNDGQGDKLLTRSFLSFLSLRGGVSRVSILSSRISISLLIFPIDKKIVLSLLYLLNSWTRAQHRSTKRSNKSISNWRNRGNRLRKSDPVLRKMR